MTTDPLDQLDWTTLAAYFAGEASATEVAELEAAIGTDPERRAAVSRLREAWQLSGQVQGWDAPAALAVVRQRAREVDRLQAGPIPTRQFALPVMPRWTVGAGLAAGVLLALLGGTLWWRTARREVPVAPPVLTELVTRRGQRAELRLSDGSRVTLGVASRLQYPERFSEQGRELYLEGEAYFEIAHQPGRPFRVRTPRGVTEDLGTAFLVTDQPELPLRVVVADGAVVLKGGATGPEGTADSVVLHRAELGQLGADGRMLRVENVDVDSYLAWREGQLVFRATPLSEVIARLGAWYDVDLALSDSTLGARRFTAVFEDEPVDQALRILSVALDLRVEHRGSLVLLAPARHP